MRIPFGRGQKHLRSRRLLVATATIGFSARVSLSESWNAGSGNWSVPGNWLPAVVPGPGDSVNIAFTDGVNRIVTYDYTGTAVAINSLTLELTGFSGTSSAVFSMPADNLTSGNEFVGNSGAGSKGIGTFNQSGGVNNVNNGGSLFLGFNSSDTGFYKLTSTGSLSVSGGELIGNNGTGNFNQTGGTNSISPLFLGLVLAYNPGSNGTYSLSGSGTLLSGNEAVGYGGAGTFNQSGGSNTPNVGLFVGFNNASTGTYLLSSTGILSSGNELIGFNGTGNFNQTGGTNTLSNGSTLYLGYSQGTTGTYSLSAGGTLSVTGPENVGNDGMGIFNQSGGINTISASNALVLGADTLSTGFYTLSNTGFLSAGLESVGKSGAAVFIQTGGTNNVAAELDLAINTASSASYSLSGGNLLVSGNAYIGGSGSLANNAAGGTGVLTVNGSGVLSVSGTLTGFNASSSAINLNGGAINAAALNFNGSPSLFNWISGTLGLTAGVTFDPAASATSTNAAFGSALTLAANQTLLVNSNEILDGTGSFTLNVSGGSNSVNGDLDIGDQAGSTGSFIITAGTGNVGGSVYVGGDVSGSAGPGLLTVGGSGVLNVTGTLTAYNTSGSAINLSGGIIKTAALNFNGIPSLFNWSSGTLDVTTAVAFDSGASPKSTGGAFGPSLAVGGSQTLIIGGNEIIGSTNSFSFTLMSNALNIALNSLYLGYNNGSTGTYVLSGAASLSVSASEFIGNLGTGNFNQSGGTNASANGQLFVGYGIGSNGFYTLSGTGTLSSLGEYVGYRCLLAGGAA